MFVHYVQALVTSESPVLHIWWAMLGHVGNFGLHDSGWRAKIGGGYFGAETLLGYVAATMFSEDGLTHLVWTTPNSWCSFGHIWG